MGQMNGKLRGKRWLKISVWTPAILMEPVSDLMAVLSGSGVELSPETSRGSKISGFFLETGKADSHGELAKDVHRKMEELFSLYGLVAPGLSIETFDDQDWATSWKRFFTPVEIAPGLIIKPSWENYRARKGERVIEMDPGQAFGTGQHASTKMALSLLIESLAERPADRMLDVGTGTGILAMAAALFGVPSVVAIDNDPEAVRVAGDNIAINNLESDIDVNGTNLIDLNGSFSMIAVNIVFNVLVSMATHLESILAPEGRVILAGILRGEQEEKIGRIYGELGLTLGQSLHDEEWAALLLQK